MRGLPLAAPRRRQDEERNLGFAFVQRRSHVAKGEFHETTEGSFSVLSGGQKRAQRMMIEPRGLGPWGQIVGTRSLFERGEARAQVVERGLIDFAQRAREFLGELLKFAAQRFHAGFCVFAQANKPRQLARKVAADDEMVGANERCGGRGHAGTVT